MRKWFNNQYDNLFLYVPFLVALGAGTYFVIDQEPNILFSIICIIVTGIAFAVKRVPVWMRAFIVIGFGFCYAAVFTNIINTPMIDRDLRSVNVVATVKSIDYMPDKTRIYLNVNANDIYAGNGNAHVRVSISEDITLPQIGDKIIFQGALFSPAPAYAPESFDYARWAYFNNLTATGYATNIEIIDSDNSVQFNALREYLHDKSNSFLADTLVLGYKNAVPKTDNEIWNSIVYQ